MPPPSTTLRSLRSFSSLTVPFSSTPRAIPPSLLTHRPAHSKKMSQLTPNQRPHFAIFAESTTYKLKFLSNPVLNPVQPTAPTTSTKIQTLFEPCSPLSEPGFARPKPGFALFDPGPTRFNRPNQKGCRLTKS